MFFRPVILLVSLLLAGFPAEARAQDAATVDEPNAAEAAVRELVDRLASSQFADRQKATEEILSLGADVVPLLQSELEKATGESATRLRLILPQLRRRLFDDRLDGFSKNPSLETVTGLPEWQRFSAIAGDDSEALTVYGEVLRAERSLFATRMFSAKELPASLETRSAAFAELLHGRADEEFPIATCVALMLLGSDPDTRLIRATSTNISDAFDDPRFGRLVKDGVHSETLKAMTGAWINRPGIAVDRPLRFAIQYELTTGRTLAHRIIRSGASNQSMYYALLCLAKLMNQEDLPIIESVFTSETKLWPPRGQTVQILLPDARLNSSFSVQTRDVALAAAIHLRGRNPAEFGMDVVPSDETVYVVHTMGFEDDETRDKVIAAYRSAFPDG